METNDRPKDFFFGALMGGAIATLTALLFTTKKGKQIQRQIGEAYEDIEEAVKRPFQEVKEKGEEVIDQVSKKVAHK